MKIWEQINADNWCQRSMALDSKGASVLPCAPSACRWCVVGWIIKTDPSLVVRNYLYQIMDRFLPSNYAGWNDAPGRTWEEVRDVFKAADL